MRKSLRVNGHVHTQKTHTETSLARVGEFGKPSLSRSPCARASYDVKRVRLRFSDALVAFHHVNHRLESLCNAHVSLALRAVRKEGAVTASFEAVVVMVPVPVLQVLF